MEVECRSYPGLFRQALLGMFDVLKPEPLPEKTERGVAVRSPDTAALLVDFLNEALSLAQANKEMYTSATFKTLSKTTLRAHLRGQRVSSFSDDIKAVTHHEAKVERDPQGLWHAHLVFDI